MLFDIAQPLELRSIDDLDAQRMHLNLAMDGVIEYLRPKDIRIETSLLMQYKLGGKIHVNYGSIKSNKITSVTSGKKYC